MQLIMLNRLGKSYSEQKVITNISVFDSGIQTPKPSVTHDEKRKAFGRMSLASAQELPE